MIDKDGYDREHWLFYAIVWVFLVPIFILAFIVAFPFMLLSDWFEAK